MVQDAGVVFCDEGFTDSLIVGKLREIVPAWREKDYAEVICRTTEQLKPVFDISKEGNVYLKFACRLCSRRYIHIGRDKDDNIVAEIDKQHKFWSLEFINDTDFIVNKVRVVEVRPWTLKMSTIYDIMSSGNYFFIKEIAEGYAHRINFIIDEWRK